MKYPIKTIMLVLLTILLALPVQALAASSKNITVSIGNVQGEVGDIVTVPVTISKPSTDIAAYGVEISFDSKALEVKQINQNGNLKDFQSNANNDKGYLRAAWADETGGDKALKDATTLFTIDFKIKDKQIFGDKSLSFAIDKESLNFTSSSNEDISFQVKNGSLTVNKSSNSKLSSLTLTDGTLNPSFSATKYEYSTTVNSTVHSIQFVPSAENAYASITVNGDTVKNGTLSKGFALNTGTNTFNIVVTAQDNSSSTYQIKVLKEKNNDIKNNTELISAEVQSNDNSIVTKTPIYRTTNQDGTKSDKIAITEDIMKEILNTFKNKDADTAKVLIPDTEDTIGEVYFTMDQSALNLLKENPVNLEISMKNAHISIPKESLLSMDEDLYFRFVPIKTETEKQEVTVRAKNSIDSIAAFKKVTILGRPMEIQTNMENRLVTLTLPVSKDVIESLQESNHPLKEFPIFIEHDDGTKELITASLGEYHEKGYYGLNFQINKFSTFTALFLAEKTDSTGTPIEQSDSSNNEEEIVTTANSNEGNHSINNSNIDKLPKTGDDSYIDTLINVSIGVVAVFLLMFIFIDKKRRARKN